MFFVLSGFLITDILINSQSDKHLLKNFYIKRILRIFPLYYLTLGIVLFILPQTSWFIEPLNYYLNNQVWLWTYLQNWLFIFLPNTDNNILHHLWSLAVEEQFYLLWPPVIMIFKNTKKLLIGMLFLLIIIMATRSLIWVYKIDNIVYFSLYTFTRIDGICIGCILALSRKLNPDFLQKKQPFIVLVFACLNFLFYFINSYYHFSFPYLALIGYTTFAMLFGLLVQEGIKKSNNFFHKVFTWKPLQFLGKISYGLYVFHWPVYIICFPYLLNIFQNLLNEIPMLNNILASLICIFIAIAMSAISYYTFERPFLKLKYKFQP